MFFNTIGVKHKDGAYQQAKGYYAKFFGQHNAAYAYLLFKTHKLTPKEIFEKPIHDIPVRLLQAAGNIATSRLTAFLKHIF